MSHIFSHTMRYRRLNRKRHKSKWLVLIIILGLVLFGVKFLSSGYFQKVVRSQKTPNNVIDSKTNQSVKLKEIVDKLLVAETGKYAVAIKNLNTTESYFLKEHEEFTAGSLYKLWVMAAVFEKIKEGQIKEDEVLTQYVYKLNREFDISSEEAELTQGIISLTVGDALRQMITISHNYAGFLLTEKIGLGKVEKFVKDNALQESYLNPPRTTAFDLVIFLEKLYKGELVDKESSQKMIVLLKDQQLNDGIPKYLPDKSKVAHKTGDIEWFKHDAGIVFSPKGDYIIVVLSESDSPAGAQEKIAQTSKAVFDYFN